MTDAQKTGFMVDFLEWRKGCLKHSKGEENLPSCTYSYRFTLYKEVRKVDWYTATPEQRSSNPDLEEYGTTEWYMAVNDRSDFVAA